MPQVTLNALRTFEAVASRLSFSKGAAALNVSPAAVSSQIRALEERLNQPLFHRRGRRVELTEAGRLLLPGVQRGLAELRQAVQRIEQNRNEGVLSVTMVPIFLQKWMLPRLTGFNREAPEIDLRVNADSSLTDFDESDIHCAIRYGPGQWPGLKSIKLMDDWFVAVCSPAYRDRIGPLEPAADLQKFDLFYAWSKIRDVWFQDSEINTEGQALPRMNDEMSTLLAAEQGQGIALSSWSLVARDIASGRLVQPVPQLIKTDWSYYFVAPPHYYEMPKVSAFRKWMIELCEAFEKPPGVN